MSNEMKDLGNPLAHIHGERQENIIRMVNIIRQEFYSDKVPPPSLRLLSTEWGNSDWAADIFLLETLCEQVKISRPRVVVECGSGVSTVLLGLLAEKYGFEVFTFEHMLSTYTTLHQILRRLVLPQVNLFFAPLRRYKDFDWYDFDPVAIPRAVDFLVIDGPPGSTFGGRYGALPLLKSHLTDGALGILDDAGRAEEKEILGRWAAEFNLQSEIKGSRRPLAILVFRQVMTNGKALVQS